MTTKGLVLGLVLATASGAQAEVPRVATEILPIQSLAQMVLGDLGLVTSILPPGASPHTHALRPSEARSLNAADVIFRVGNGLTPTLDRPIDSLSGDARIVTLMDVPGTVALSFRNEVVFEIGGDKGNDHGHDEHGHDDHGHDDHGHDDHGDDDHAHDDDAREDHGHDDHGHAHADGAIDPHAWLDPQNARLWVTHIGLTLSEIDPANADTYAANAAAARSEIDRAVAEATDLLAATEGPFVVFHDAYQYFENAFGTPIIGSISAADAVSPSPQRLDTLRDEVTARGVACLFAEPQFQPGLVAALTGDGGLPVAVLDPIGADLPAGAGHYPALLRDMARRIAQC